MQSFEVGEKVCWRTPQGAHTGTVVERREDEFHLARQRFTASRDKPAYVVECHETGARAAHAPEALQPAEA
jgi:surface antigen